MSAPPPQDARTKSTAAREVSLSKPMFAPGSMPQAGKPDIVGMKSTLRCCQRQPKEQNHSISICALDSLAIFSIHRLSPAGIN
jgi:hypothetical protein